MILAQYGHNDRVRIKEALEGNSIDGVIFSPQYIGRAELQNLFEEYRNASPNAFFLFDSLYYLSNMGVNKTGKLGEYSYFAEYPTMFDVSKKGVIEKISQESIDLQKEIGLQNICISTVLINSFTDWTAQTVISLINNGVEYATAHVPGKDIFISLTIAQPAFQDAENMGGLIDYLTLLPVKGFYLNILRTESSISWYDVGTFANIMYFINALSLNSFDVHVGYSDFEGLLFLLAGAKSFGSGYWKNTRTLNRSRFLENDGWATLSKFYTSKILMSHLNLNPEIDAISSLGLMDTAFKNNIFSEVERPSSLDLPQKTQLMNMWNVFRDLATELEGKSNFEQKKAFILDTVHEADKGITNLKTAGVIFHRDFNSRFPRFWEDVITLYEKNATIE